MSMGQAPQSYEVELPGGGKLHLQTIDEVDLFETTRDRYLTDFRISTQSDKLLIGAILSQHLELFRSQQLLTGMQAEVDATGVPTGRYVKVQVKQTDRAAAFKVITAASEEIRNVEKALGIDKKTRDQGGQYDVATYVEGLKTAARSYGAHVSKRYLAYDEFATALRVKLRMLNNLDREDLATENISHETVCDWAWAILQKLEEADKKYAHEKGKAFVGIAR